MKSKNLVAETLMCVFAIVSFTVYAISTMTENKITSYLAVLIYIIPQLINVTNEFSKEHLNPVLSRLSIVIIGIGVIVVSTWFALIANGLDPNLEIKGAIVCVSGIFMFYPIYDLIVEIRKHYNIHKSITES